MIIGGYAAGLLVVDRLYRVMKSNLYTMPWCVSLASKLQAILAWRGKRTVEAPTSDAGVNPQMEASESKLSP